jgi:hypothetical protein
MLDVYDSTLGDYKFIPYDFNPDQMGTQIRPLGYMDKNS